MKHPPMWTSDRQTRRDIRALLGYLPDRLDLPEDHPDYKRLMLSKIMHRVIEKPLDPVAEWLSAMDIKEAVRFQKVSRNLPIDYMGAHSDGPPDDLASYFLESAATRVVASFLIKEPSSARKKKKKRVRNHWVSVALLRHPETFVAYFDSRGDPPPREIRRLMYDIVPDRARHRMNRVVYQEGTVECAMYAIAFALGDKYTVADDEMRQRRQEYFGRRRPEDASFQTALDGEAIFLAPDTPGQ